MLSVYVLCLGGAALNHARLLAQLGWQLDPGAAVWQNVFWTSLTVLDALAVLLLMRRPWVGVRLAVLIMLADVAVNVFSVRQGMFELRALSPLLGQVAFLGFVLGSAPFLLRHGQRERDA